MLDLLIARDNVVEYLLRVAVNRLSLKMNSSSLVPNRHSLAYTSIPSVELLGIIEHIKLVMITPSPFVIQSADNGDQTSSR